MQDSTSNGWTPAKKLLLVLAILFIIIYFTTHSEGYSNKLSPRGGWPQYDPAILLTKSGRTGYINNEGKQMGLSTTMAGTTHRTYNSVGSPLQAAW